MNKAKVTKLNRRPLTIYTTSDGEYYFNFRGKRHYLKEYLRAHNNPWFNGECLPDFILGVHTDYFSGAPLIELKDEKINVYK